MTRTIRFFLAAFRRNVYLSPDRGRTWRQIAADGKWQ